MEEIWKTINGHPDYEVSNIGNFRTKDRYCAHNEKKGVQFRKAHPIKTIHEGNGYLQVRLMCPKQKIFSAHRFVAEMFVPNPDNKPFVNHIDGVKDNNVYTNLEWVTRSENAVHSFEIGLQCNKGINHPSHKLTENQVREIRSKYIPQVYSSYRLAREYNISRVTVNDIINRKTWPHLI